VLISPEPSHLVLERWVGGCLTTSCMRMKPVYAPVPAGAQTRPARVAPATHQEQHSSPTAPTPHLPVPVGLGVAKALQGWCREPNPYSRSMTPQDMPSSG